MKRHEALSLALLAALSALLGGCPSTGMAPGGVQIAHPVLVEPNTFGFEAKWWDKNVAHASIVTADWSTTSGKHGPPAWIGPCASAGKGDLEFGPPFTTRWAVRAITPVSAQGFRLVPGHVPEGFEQILPSGGETFTPIAGQVYYILVCLEPVDKGFVSVGAQWSPGPAGDRP